MDLYMITTIDNPFSPVTNYDAWLVWDMARYNSNALLARVVYTSDELSEADQVLAIQAGIDEIVAQNVSGVHTKVRAGSIEFGVEDKELDRSSAGTSAA